MRIVHVSTQDARGGAYLAAHRLHSGLRAHDQWSRMVVQRKVSDDADVLGPAGFYGRLVAAARNQLDRFPLHAYPARRATPFTLAWLPGTTARRVRRLRPDIVHLHWIARGHLRLEDLQALRAPLVWTLHDMWAFTGGCHYDEDCGRFGEGCGHCPQLGARRERDLSRWVWNRKQRAWRSLDLTLVAPSRWLAERARSSPLLGKCRIVQIPNGIDLQRFAPMDRAQARRELGLPADKRLILFGAIHATSDRRKGYEFLDMALRLLKSEPHHAQWGVAIFGCDPSTAPELPGFDRYILGRLSGDESLRRAFGAADLFVAPSLQDNLPNTVVEAMACGLPCVGFDAGGIPDMIDHRENGYLARYRDAADLAAGIAWILGDDSRWRRLSACARRTAEERFSIERVVPRYLDLYESVVSAHAD